MPSPRRPALLIALAAAVLAPAPARARQPETAPAPPPESDLSFIDHAPGRFWYGAQVNAIFQAHPPFHAPYSGPQSLRSHGEAAISGLATVFLAYTPTRTTELIVDPEVALDG